MHSEIIKFWLRKDSSYKIFREQHRWILYSHDSQLGTIAFLYRKEIVYYTKLHGLKVLSEENMLSYIKLQVFL